MRISDVSSDVFSSDLGIFLFVFAIMLLAMQLHRLQQRRVGAFQALADEQALRAAERELMIGEMAHRMKNAFARIGALARITLRESTSRSEEHTSELQSLMRISYAVFCLKKKKEQKITSPHSKWIKLKKTQKVSTKYAEKTLTHNNTKHT